MFSNTGLDVASCTVGQKQTDRQISMSVLHKQAIMHVIVAAVYNLLLQALIRLMGLFHSYR